MEMDGVGDFRERIFAVALGLVRAGGHGALRARSVADAAGCSVGTLYNAYGDLDGLAVALKAYALAALDATLLEGLAGASGAGGRLHALAQSYLRFAREEPMLWGMLFRHRVAAPSLPDWYVASLDAIFRRIDEPLRELVPTADADARAGFGRALFSAVHGIVSLGLEEKIGAVDLGRLSRRLTAVVGAVIAGLAAGPGVIAPGC